VWQKADLRVMAPHQACFDGLLGPLFLWAREEASLATAWAHVLHWWLSLSMSSSTSFQSSEVSLSHALRRDKSAIVLRWEERVRGVRESENPSRRSLRHHVHELIEELAAELEGEHVRQAARDHGRTKAEQDFLLEGALADLSILREVTIEVLAGGVAAAQLDVDTQVRIHRFFDIAMADAAEEVMRRSEETLRQDAAFRGRMLGILSHDLRNPLGAISMGAQLIVANPLARPEITRAAQRVASSAARMTRMIRDLLDYTRKEQHGASSLRIEVEQVDAGVLVREIVEELRAMYPTREVVVEMEEEIVGTWDRDRLAQVISNLVGNAIEHGDARAPIRVRLLKRGTDMQLVVHNDGAPIGKELVEHLFEPFFRGEGGQHHRGLGLGLYIAREITRAHGGELELTRSDGDGTAFTVLLPICAAASEPGRPRPGGFASQ